MSKAANAFATLLTQRDYSPRTSEAYLIWARKLESHFPSSDVRTLRQADIAAFFTHLQTMRFKSESIRQATSAIRLFVKEILKKPALADAVPKVKENRPQARLPSQEEILRVLLQVGEPQTKMVLQCIYGLGLELQEARALRVKSFDFADGKLRFTSQRTKVTRTIPIPAVVLDSARKHAAEKSAADFMFSAKPGTSLSESTIQRSWSEARERARVGSHAGIRSLRHCYVRHMELLGMRLVDVLENLGIRKGRALAYYAAYHVASAEMPFSPLDRTVYDDIESLSATTTPYVSEARITQIASLPKTDFEFVRLAALLQELNVASRAASLFSVAFLVRAVIDHVPPLFGVQKFSEVSNNYAGTKSFKKSMGQLNDGLRNIADSYLHGHIRAREDLPHLQQVDFRAQVDQLLGEIVRVHKRRKAA